jgi:hypothetical protein
LNNIAPVGKIVVHKYDPKYPAGCPSCSEDNEMQEHMIRCPCEKREEWWVKLIKEITETLDEYLTPMTVQQLMLEGI